MIRRTPTRRRDPAQIAATAGAAAALTRWPDSALVAPEAEARLAKAWGNLIDARCLISAERNRRPA